MLIDLKREKDGFSLDKSDALKIRDTLLPSMKVIDGKTLNYGHEIYDDVQNKQELISSLLLSGLAREHNIPIYAFNVNLSVEAVADNIFQVNTNLGKVMNKSAEEIHELIKKPFFEITATNLQLLRMKSVDAVSGFTEVQSTIISQRIDFVSKLIYQMDSKPEFTRICRLTNTPVLPHDHSINIDQLIELRESSEAYAFRDWLQNSNKFSDAEIEEITSSWRKRTGEVLNGKNAQGLRWLAATGADFLIGDATGIITSGLDHFLDKFFPGMGPIAFITKGYTNFVHEQK